MQSGVVVLGVALLGVCDVRADTQPAPSPVRREGRISIERIATDRSVGTWVSATFTNTPVWGVASGTDGPCSLRRYYPGVGLSAGTITIAGSITLVEQPTGRGVAYQPRLLPYPYGPGAPITVETDGGSNIPAFTRTVNAPEELTGYTPPTSLFRTSSYTARWTAVPGTQIVIVIEARNAQHEGLDVVCRVPDTGTFTVPKSTFRLIPESLDRAVVIVSRIAETVEIHGDTRVIVDVMSSFRFGPFALGFVERRIDTSPAPEVPPPRDSPRRFLAFAIGFTPARTWRFQVGQRLAHGLHLVGELDSLGSGYVSADTYEDDGSFGAGVRWTPFEPRPRPAWIRVGPYIDVNAFYLTAIVGGAFRERQTKTMDGFDDHTRWSPMGSLAVGVLEFQGHDWTLGPEIRWELSRFDRKLQRDWQALLTIHLNQW